MSVLGDRKPYDALLKRYLPSWAILAFCSLTGNVVEVVSVIVKERKHAGKHLSVLACFTTPAPVRE